MSRSVRSDEPIKKLVVFHLKGLTRCTKVTLVKEIGPHLFQAHCTIAPTKGAKGTSLGFYRIDLSDQDKPKYERIGDYVR